MPFNMHKHFVEKKQTQVSVLERAQGTNRSGAPGRSAVCWEMLAPERLDLLPYVIDSLQEKSKEFAKLRDGK